MPSSLHSCTFGPRSAAVVAMGACARQRLLLIGLALMLAGRADAGTAPTLTVEVDARELPRKLLHAQIIIPCTAGKLTLYYPKWIPGTHAPSGPVQNIGGLRFETSDGKALTWRRDEVELFAFHIQVPPGVSSVRAKLDYICNPPSGSFGNNSLGTIDWNTVLLYPEGHGSADLKVDLSLRLPDAWQFATALNVERQDKDLVTFKTESLYDLIDNPLIAAKHLKSFKLTITNGPPAFFDVASESAKALELDDKTVAVYSRVVNEAHSLFGTAHYPAYRFLVTCSNDLGYHGLEHHRCSINGVHERDLIDVSRRRGWVANLLPHEYAHSWCGKFRRPAGMCVPDYHTPPKQHLLWIYEGLTEYLGELLMVRSGLVSQDEYLDYLSWNLGNLMKREGRKWRSLEDTSISSPMLRVPSASWNDLRRSQDYYYEGMLLWLEVDAMLRTQSKGRHSLDDFCQQFLGKVAAKDKVVPYELKDVTVLLKKLADYDWDKFFARRVSAPQETLPLDVVELCGCKLEYATKPTPYTKHVTAGATISARDSLGVDFNGVGKIGNLVPGMPGDKAGLAPGMRVDAINGKKWSGQRVYDALVESREAGKMEFQVAEGGGFRSIVVEYGGGPKYLQIVRDPARDDVIGQILRPRH
jgi:predicted metalloprotease with PDZ domain